MTIFYTSDWHLGHLKVSQLRGFATPAEHDAQLVENCLAVVQPGDTIRFLGDMSINSGNHVMEVLSYLPTRNELFSGNHDKTHTEIFRHVAAQKIALWHHVFDVILDEAVVEIAGRPVTLSHFPYFSWGDGPTRGPARFTHLRPWESETSILLHGHTHGPEIEHGRSFHVGVDAHNLQLVPEERIAEWVRSLA